MKRKRLTPTLIAAAVLTLSAGTALADPGRRHGGGPDGLKNARHVAQEAHWRHGSRHFGPPGGRYHAPPARRGWENRYHYRHKFRHHPGYRYRVHRAYPRHHHPSGFFFSTVVPGFGFSFGSRHGW